MVECGLMLLRIEDGGRRRGALVDRAGPTARVLEDRAGVVILAVTGTPVELQQTFERLRGFEITGVVRSKPLAISAARVAAIEVVSADDVRAATASPFLERP